MDSRKTLAQQIEKHFRQDSRIFAFYADFLINRGENNKAMSVLKENINKYPDYSTGELILGELFLKQNKIDQAEMLLKGALEKDKTNVRALKIMADISDSKNDKEARLFYLREILKYDPLDQDARTILMLNESDNLIFDGRSGSYDEEDLEEERAAAAEAAELDKEEILSKLDSSPDIDIPEIPIAEDEDVFQKHKFGDLALDKEKSFSEDIIESLDTLTDSFIDEHDEKEKEEPEKSGFENIVSFKQEEAVEEVEVEPEVEIEPEVEVKPEEILNINYKDEDPAINELLNELTLSAEEYKSKMDSALKLVVEDNENYDYLVDLAYARFRYAAFTTKKEILYYYKMTKEEPRNLKYSEKLKSFREEILKLKDDLIEQLNMLKNRYY